MDCYSHKRSPPPFHSLSHLSAAFFLKEANQDIMRNSSLQARTEPFFIQEARQMPFINASYGPLSAQQPIPLELLQSPGPFNGPSFTSLSSSSSSPSLFTYNWKVHTFIISERIHPSWPKVQVLFYVGGRDWDDYTTIHRLPCVRMFAFHETQEVRGTCRLKGELGMCVAELEPLASWFSPPTVRPGRQRSPEQPQGTPVELYYMVQSTETGECSSEDSRKGSSMRTEHQGPMGYFSGPTPMQRIGSVRLFQPMSELRLDSNFVVMVPSRPIRQREIVSTFLALSILSPVQIFTLRPEAGYQKVVQVDLEVNGLLDPQGSRMVTWQVEYPLTRSLTDEVQTLIRLAPQDLGGIVPLAMNTEILNTAVLTGRTVAVPVKVVTVGTDGTVTDVTESVECRSTDEEVVKVSDRCDYVFVNGKETRGRMRMVLNFTYSYLSAQLEMSVWMPRLPLLIDIANPELSQIKGWRVPVAAGNKRSVRVSEDDGDEVDSERTESGCVPQYQSTTVRVLTHFMALGADGLGQQDFLLGSDWQVDVTDLVQDSLRVEDQRVARLLKGQVLMGLSTGTAKLQVMSPLSDSILAERMVRVLEDKVSVTELGVQLVSGLALSLQLSPGSNRAIVATASTQEVMQKLKQESLISAWLQFSDGSMTPLDHYDPAHFVLTATSLDEQVVTVQRSTEWKWPVIVAKGEGQGLLVRVEMSSSEICRKTKRSIILAAGVGNISVRFGSSEEPYSRPGGRTRPDPPYYGGSISDIEAGIMNRDATTVKASIPVRPNGDRLLADGGVPGEFSEFPAQAELPRGRSTEEDLLSSRRSLTDLEIGMYALLGVFFLAILVFLINCISYALKYRSKELPLEAPEAMPHAHDWVWLGQDEGLCLQQQQDELGSTLEEGSQLLNGGALKSSAQGSCPGGRNESLNSPTTKRKRVKFTTFSNVKPNNGCPVLSPLALGLTSDIKWVCPDIELGDSQELRNYMERLNENATKNIV
uniref:Transmembrane protein 132C n=1 Tax=Salmo trutta TaxID=8032 RepID=A0A674BU58_SALTR